MDPELLFIDNQTMDGQLAMTLYPLRAGVALLSGSGVIAMALAAIGLYGAIAYSVARRTREIGIRMALGAARARVLGLVMRQGLAVVGAGLVLGCALAFAASRTLANILYGITPSDPVAWASAVSILLGVAILANLIPARRAARVEPTVALRSE
jgi:putative ABC transport system permease protein